MAEGTMRVRIVRATVAGKRALDAGEIVDLPRREAVALIARKRAVPAGVRVEAATAEPPEQAVKSKAKKRKRG